MVPPREHHCFSRPRPPFALPTGARLVHERVSRFERSLQTELLQAMQSYEQHYSHTRSRPVASDTHRSAQTARARDPLLAAAAVLAASQLTTSTAAAAEVAVAVLALVDASYGLT